MRRPERVAHLVLAPERLVRRLSPSRIRPEQLTPCPFLCAYLVGQQQRSRQFLVSPTTRSVSRRKKPITPESITATFGRLLRERHRQLEPITSLLRCPVQWAMQIPG